MLFGDPINDPVFTQSTGVDLTEGEHTVLVLASSPESAKTRFPEVDQEVMRRVGRLLRAEGCPVVRNDDVLDWVENLGGTWNEFHLGGAAAKFEADYVVTVELDHFGWTEPNSPDLLKGRSGGSIRAFVADGDGAASPVFTGSYESVYPTHGFETAGNVTDKLFRERFLDRLARQVSQQFLPHRPRDTIY